MIPVFWTIGSFIGLVIFLNFKRELDLSAISNGIFSWDSKNTIF